MGNEEYVKNQLNLIGARRLIKKQIEALKLINDKSKIEKKVLEFANINTTDLVHYSDIEGCGMKTVIRIGTDTNDEEVYFCFYCDRDFQLDKWDFRYSAARPAL